MAGLKVACVLLPDLPVQIEQQRRNITLPIIVPHPVIGGVVLACSPEAAAAGVQAGMSLYQAQQMVPHAVVVEPDEMAYHASHDAVHAALQAYSPLIETVGLGEFLVDVRGVSTDGATDKRRTDERPPNGATDRAAGKRIAEQSPVPCPASTDDSLAAELLAAAQAATGLSAQVGLAAGKFVAGQAARQAPPGSALVVPLGGEGRFVAPLPVTVLPNLPGEMRRRLYLFDLYTLGDLVALRKAAVLRQFGAEISGLFELARGNDPRPLMPDVPPLRVVRSLRLASPVTDRQVLLNALNRLCWQMAQTLTRKGYHAEALKLAVHTATGARLEAGQAVKPPTADEARLARLAAMLLGRVALEAPVEVVALSAYPLRSWHIGLHQAALVAAGVSEKQTRFEAALQLLCHRFGQAALRVAALLGPPVPVPVRVTLDAEGQPVRYELGGVAQSLLRVEDNWREERSWWDRPLRRDYFRVALPDGSLRKLFQNLIDGDWYLDRSWPLL